MFNKGIAVAALVALMFAAPALAQQAQVAQTMPLGLVKDVTKQVLAYTRFTVFDDVSVTVGAGGVVTLTGKVTMPYKATDIATRVAGIPGVTQVKNEIEVLPVSIFDSDLRVRVARAIYGNSAFWPYASMVNPPIHIVVEHGRVTLTGVVNDNTERMLAYSLASSCGAFSVDNELKTDREMRPLLEKMNGSGN